MALIAAPTRNQLTEIGRVADNVMQLIQSQKEAIKVLESHILLQQEEIESLKERQAKYEAQLGSQMFQRHEPLQDLVKSVEHMREVLTKKMAEKGAKPVKVVVTEVSAVPSTSFAQELVEGDAGPQVAPGPVIEEIV